jgi:hypothetical protein
MNPQYLDEIPTEVLMNQIGLRKRRLAEVRRQVQTEKQELAKLEAEAKRRQQK